MAPHRLQRLLAVLPLLLTFGSLASADAITGRVVDPNGAGVAGVDIDFVNLGSGGNPHELNDGTDANGNFLTTVDPGVYEVRFFAPQGTSLLTGVLASVVIVGTKDVGTIPLVLGASTTGTTKNTAGVPVANVRVDVFDLTTGAKVLMKNNVTNAFGNFNVIVPMNVPLRTELLTGGVVGQVLVPRELFGTVTGSTSFGTKTLLPGFHVTGTVRNQLGAAILGADVDVTDPVTGDTFFTPSDNTNTLGVFDVVLPAGTFDLEVNRPATAVLVGVDVDNLVVSAATNLGVLTMRNGVFLSGTVRNSAGATVQAADVNVFEVATGLSIALGSDNTNALGFYSVVVPTGLLDVVFSPPGPHHALAKDRHFNVSVTTNTTLDGEFPGAPPRASQHAGLPKPVMPLPFGSAAPGTGGSVPHIRGTLGKTGLTLWITGARPGASARILLGSEHQTLAARSGLELVRPEAQLPLVLDARGEARLHLSLGNAARLGRALDLQLVVLDPGAARGLATSHVLAIERAE